MTIIAGTTVDWKSSPRVITVPFPVDEVTIEDLQDTLQDIEDSEIGVVFLKLRSTAGGEDLGGGTFVGWTMQLQNAQLQFAGRTTATESGAVSTSDTTGTLLHAVGGLFVTNGVVRGDTVFNSTTGSIGTVLSVTDENNLVSQQITGGSRTTWLNTDSYTIYKNTQCNISGGNLVAVDGVGASIPAVLQSANTNIIRTSSSSATTQSQLQLEHTTFGGAVTVDTVNGTAGTAYPIGTPGNPVNNMEDAHTIADSRGFYIFQIKGNITLGLNDYSDGHRFNGDSPITTSIVLEDLANVDNCEFTNCYISGIIDDNNIIRECIVGDMTSFDGFFDRCAMSGVVTLGGTTSTSLVDCFTNEMGGVAPEISIGSGSALNLVRYAGEMVLSNKTGTDFVDVDLASGLIELDSTITNGTLFIRGVGRLEDESTGTAVVINELVNGAELSNLQRILELQRPHHKATGNVWYWDPYGGSDTSDGKHISKAVKTFAQAQTLASDNNHDLIIAIPGDPSGVTTTTENLAITKNFLFLRGPGRDFVVNSVDDNKNAVSITSNGVEVSGMQVSTSATSLEDAIHTNGNFTLLKDLWISGSVNGVHFENGEYGIADNVKMHHNSGWGLKFSGTADHVDIIDCHIGSNHLDNVIIDLSPTTHEVNFLGDTVIHSSVTGYGINISGSTNGVIIHDSVAVFNNAAGDINDLSSTTYNQATTTNTNIAGSVWDADAESGQVAGSYGELLHNTSYNHYAIHVDTDALVNGDGSQSQPFDNLQDGKDFAESVNYRNLMIYADCIATGNLKGFIVDGIGAPKFEMASGNLTGSEFKHISLKVSGYSGHIVAQDCAILAGCELNGYSENCAFTGDIAIIGDTHIINGRSQATGAGYVNITTGNNTLQVTDWHRSLGIKGMTAGTHTIEMYGGQLHLDASCTGGTIYLRGNYSVAPDDLSTGTVIIDQTEAQGIAGSVWNSEIEGSYTAEEVLRIMSAALAGKATGLDVSVPVFRDIGDTKDRITAITDSSGNRSSITLDAS